MNEDWINQQLSGRRVKKIKSATERTNDNGAFVLITVDGRLEKHFRPINRDDTGFFTTTTKYAPTKTARWVGGKSKNNPCFMNPCKSVVAYSTGASITPNTEEQEKILFDGLRKLGLID